MNFLLLLFASFLSFAAGPTCGDLKTILEDLEKKYMDSRLTPEVCQAENLEVIPGGAKKATQLELIKENKCKNLAFIDLKIRSLENELAMIAGLKKLKNEVKTTLNKTKSAPKFDEAKVAAESFLFNLDIAKHFELLLRKSTGQKNKENVLQFLAGLPPEQIATKEELQKRIDSFCASTPSTDKEIDLCTKGEFKLNDTIFNEIHAFVTLGKNNNTFKNKISELDKAFSISLKDGTKTSFTAMSIKMKKNLGNVEEMEKETVNAIKELPDFQDSSFGFLTGLKNSQESLSAKAMGQEYRHFLTDLTGRQRWEMKSKLSLLIKEYAEEIDKKKLSDNCKDSLKNLQHINDCLEPIVSTLEGNSVRKAHLIDMIKEFEVSGNYLQRLDTAVSSCIPDEKLNFPKMSSGGLSVDCDSAVLASETKLQEDHEALSALKNKILESNKDIETFRNYAIEQFEKKDCKARINSEISDCYGSLESSQISLNALVLTGNVLDIILVQNDRTKDTKIDKLCSDKNIKFAKKDILCKVEEEKDDSYNRVDKDLYRHTTEPGNGYSPNTKNAWVDVLGSFLGYGLSRAMNPPMGPPQMPYQPMPSYPALSESQKVSMSSDSMCVGCYIRWPQPGGPGNSAYFGNR